MRILMINRHNAYSVFGGDTVQMEKTKNALEKLGVQVDVCLSDQIGSVHQDYDIFHIFNLKTPIEVERCVNFATERSIPWVLSTVFYDHTETWYWQAVLYKYRWKLLARLCGNSITEQFYRSWQSTKNIFTTQWHLQRSLLMRASALLPNSFSEAVALKHFFKIFLNPQKLFVIPNGIDCDIFCDLEQGVSDQWVYLKDGQIPIVLQVGRISPEKNNAALIEALWDLRVRIVFAGQFSPLTPDYTTHCLNLAKQRGNVFFLGKVEHEKLPGLYRIADVHAIPSWGESAGLVSLEAAICGCKIVSTFIGGTRDYLGDDAWYCNPSDVVSIRQAVIGALAGEKTDKLKNRILENFTWSIAGRKTLKVYEKILEVA